MEVWPSGVGLRGRASNHPVLRWLKTVVVSDRGKGAGDASGGDQEDVPESARRGATLPGVVVEASLRNKVASKLGILKPSSGRAWRVPADWPGGARRGGGVSLVCCSCTEREKAGADTADRSLGLFSLPVARGSVPRQLTEGTEYRCGARRRTSP